MKTLTLSLFILIIVIPGARAATYHISPGQSIQSTIDYPWVVNGDELVVEKGVYKENINFNGKNIILRSTEPENLEVVEKTFIDGGRNGPVVTFDHGENANCTISGFTLNNGLADDGGGIICYMASPTVTNNIITGNSGDYAILCDCASPIIKNNLITENPGGIKCRALFHLESSPLILNNIISKNSHSFGGGIYCHASSPKIKGNIITQNHATWGGGIFGKISSVEIENNIISENTASYDGGGIYVSGSEAIIKNNLIHHNRADYDAGGIGCTACSPLIINNTITENEASYGGGISTLVSTPQINNCIMWGNLARNDASTSSISGEAIVSYSDVQGGWSGEGNIDIDPFFADPCNNDYHLMSEAGRFDAASRTWVKDDLTSPCIDAGNFASYLGYEPFPNGGRVNMGAYGGTDEASKSYFGRPVCETVLAGDVNGDCIVNSKDFALMSLNWLRDEN